MYNNYEKCEVLAFSLREWQNLPVSGTFIGTLAVFIFYLNKKSYDYEPIYFKIAFTLQEVY